MLLTGWFVRMCEGKSKWRMRRVRKRPQRRLNWAAECLETRALLSGVAVTSHAGTITLNGSGANTVNAAIVDGNLELTGSNGTTFTFQGQTSDVVDVALPNNFKALKVNLGSGDTTFNFDGTGLDNVGSVAITAGNGNDVITVSNVTTTGTISVNAGNGADQIQLTDDTAAGAAIHVGNGDDTIGVSGTTLTGVGTSTAGASATKLNCGPVVPGLSSILAQLHLSNKLLKSLGLLNPSLKAVANVNNELAISTGSGNDTIEVDSTTGTKSGANGNWAISLGKGNDTLTLDSDTNAGGLTVKQAGKTSTTDSVGISNSTFGGPVSLQLAGTDVVDLESDTFNAPVTVTTGLGSGSEIDVNDSTFSSLAAFTMQGPNATLNLQTNGTTDTGTTFNGPFITTFGGVNGTANFAGSSDTDFLTFNNTAKVVGHFPGATVNETGANTTFNDGALTTVLATVNIM